MMIELLKLESHRMMFYERLLWVVQIVEPPLFSLIMINGKKLTGIH